MPWKSQNIPHKMFYSAKSVQILRICEATNKFKGFTKSAKILIGRIIKQVGLINHMKKVLLKLFNSHKECLIRFEKTDCNYFIIILFYN